MSKEKEKTTESVVKENLTSEQRAREYAEGMLNMHENIIDKSSWHIQYFSAYELMDAYLEGTNQLAAYREALKELTVSIDTIYRNYESGHIEGLFNSLTNAWAYCIEAKQLIEEGEDGKEIQSV